MSTSVTPFALSLLRAETIARRVDSDNLQGGATAENSTQPAMEVRTPRTSRRSTSYHNPFQTVCSTATDDPPSYAASARHRAIQHTQPERDALPNYSCTVSAETKMLLYLESLSPLHGISESEWRDVFVVLRGTLLSLHRVKDGAAGKLLRSYTLQHAEVGLATDSQHTVLVPNHKFAHLIPSAARRKAWQKDPTLFKPVRQHILRLRAETDQLLLACSSEDRLRGVITALSAAIDISLSIDERGMPRQCTVPRRRRRQQASGNISDPGLLAEQERIFREMYPSFADETRQAPASPTPEDSSSDVPASPGREEDDLDLAAIREDSAPPSPALPQDAIPRSATLRHSATSSDASPSAYSDDMMYATSRNNFDLTGKWRPPHLRTPLQVQRYIRRCMPVLQADSVRASDVLICNGSRVKINWRMELMEHWELRPPSYKSHGFTTDGPDSERDTSISQVSLSRTATQENAPASSSVNGSDNDDPVTPVEVGNATFTLSKAKPNESGDQGFPFGRPAVKTSQRANHANLDVNGMVFCF